MTSVQVDAAVLRTAARQLGTAARELAATHERAAGVLHIDVPHLRGGAAVQARDMLEKALTACCRLGDGDQRLADALGYAAEHVDQLESHLVSCFDPAHGIRPDAAP